MNFARLVSSLERFSDVLKAAVAGISEEDARWKPTDGGWSILEVVCHLGDEEELDFRRRLKLTLTDPTQPWPPNDPVAWAVEHRYNEGHLDEALARFLAERKESIGWLRSLDNPDWTQAYQHPKVGPVPAGDLLASWAAHDYLHLRQIAKRLYEMTIRDASEFDTAYAGEWVA